LTRILLSLQMSEYAWQVAGAKGKTKAAKVAQTKAEKVKEPKVKAKSSEFAAIHSGSFSSPLWSNDSPSKRQNGDDADVEDEDEIDMSAIVESDTLYSQFEDIQDRKLQAAAAAQNGREVKKPPKEKKPKKPKRSLIQASTELGADVESYIVELEDKYKDNIEVQLNGLADHFEKAFRDVGIKWEKILSEKEFSERVALPAKELTDSTRQIVNRWLKAKPKAAMVKLLTTLLKIAFSPVPADPKTVPVSHTGLKIYTQLVIRAQPSILFDSVPEVAQEWSKKGRMLVSAQPTFIWVLSQAIPSSPATALALWSEHLLPMLTDHTLPNAIRDSIFAYIEAVLSKESLPLIKSEIKSSSTEVPVSIAAVERILTLTHSNASGVLPQVRDRLQLVYSPLQDTIFFPHPTFNPRIYFPALLRLMDGRDPAIGTEAVRILTAMVARNKRTLSVWGDVYAVNLNSSRILLQSLLENCSELRDKLSTNAFVERVRSFIKLNEDMLAGKHKLKAKGAGKDGAVPRSFDKGDLEACHLILKELDAKLQRKREPEGSWLALVVAFLLLAISAVCAAYLYDPSPFTPYVEQVKLLLAPNPNP